MDQKIIEILKKIKSKYQDINTILLFGSATTSDWTPESDIDIFLIDDKFHDSRKNLIIDGIQIEIQQDNFSNITKDIKNERGRLNNRNVATMIDGSIIIKTNSENNVQDLKSLAESVLQSTPTFTDEDVKMWRYSIDDYLAKAEKDLKRGDAIAFYFDANYVIQNATELTLATHGAYFPQTKRLATLLQQIAPEFHDILQSFASEPDLDSKLKILQKLKTFDIVLERKVTHHMETQNDSSLIKEKAKESNRAYGKEQKNPVAAAVGFWFLGLISCLLPIIMPRVFFSFSLLSFLTAIFAPVVFIIIGAFHYKNKVFNKKEEIIKSLKHFRIAYILLWVLFIASIIASIIFMKSCFAWGCIVIIAIAPIIVAIFAYAITFSVIALELKKKL